MIDYPEPEPMKLSTFIAQCQAVLASKGDLDIYAWPYDGQARRFTPSLQVTDDFTVFIEGD